MNIKQLPMFAAMLWLRSASQGLGIVADPNPIDWKQPDGLTITLHLRGGEFSHWREDLEGLEGFTVVLEGHEYVYARLDAQNHLVPTPWQVGRVDPRAMGVTPHLLPPPETRPANLNHSLAPYRPWAVDRGGVRSPKIAAKGTAKNLMILCKFADHTGFPGQPGWPANSNHYRVALLQVMSFSFRLSPVLLVDRSYLGGWSNGSLATPDKTLHEAYNAALDGYTISMRGNIYHEAPFPMTKRITLDAYDGAATISQ